MSVFKKINMVKSTSMHSRVSNNLTAERVVNIAALVTLEAHILYATTVPLVSVIEVNTPHISQLALIGIAVSALPV
jgi:hypothetical protein